MRVLVVYESMFGSTRRIAEAIAEGIGGDATVVRAADAGAAADPGTLDLLVVGAPTHVHGLPRPSTRSGAPEQADPDGSGLVLEPGADTAPGVREWLDSLSDLPVPAAAFDTRVDGPAAFTGRASRSIAKGLARHGVIPAAPAESFLVDRHAVLLPGELDRARSWGARLAELASTGPAARRR